MPPKYKIYEVANIRLSSPGIFDITSIPGTYDTLEIFAQLRTTIAATVEGLAIQINNELTASHYLDWTGYYNGASLIYDQKFQYTPLTRVAGDTAGAGRYASLKMFITSYADSATKKQINIVQCRPETIAANDVCVGSEVLQINANPITRLTIFPASYPTNNFKAGSWIHVLAYSL